MMHHLFNIYSISSSEPFSIESIAKIFQEIDPQWPENIGLDILQQQAATTTAASGIGFKHILRRDVLRIICDLTSHQYTNHSICFRKAHRLAFPIPKNMGPSESFPKATSAGKGAQWHWQRPFRPVPSSLDQTVS